jgi:hypothetical protein
VDFILIIRVISFLTFILLTAEGVAAIIIGRRFYALYVRKHLELEDRVKALELIEKHKE